MAVREHPIEMQEKRFNYFPKTFRWRGNQYRVDTVERCWNATRGTPKLFFRVRCAGDVFYLSQNLGDDTWQLEQTT